MNKLTVERCPETGICSILKPDGTKVDLMPDEVADIQIASGDEGEVKAAISEADEQFSAALTSEEIAAIVSALE